MLGRALRAEFIQAPLWYHTRCSANYQACHGVRTGFNSLRLEPAKQVRDRVQMAPS